MTECMVLQESLVEIVKDRCDEWKERRDARRKEGCVWFASFMKIRVEMVAMVKHDDHGYEKP